MKKERVAVIGSGNWGSAITRIMANNVREHGNLFERDIRMWVFEEIVNNRKLTELINEKHENVKYLPGYKIPDNVRAIPDLIETVQGATILVFVVPHQFVLKVCEQLKGKISSDVKAISLIKGFHASESGLKPITHVISEYLNINVSSLSGANIAHEIAEEKFSETTIGYKNVKDGELFKILFETKYFRVGIVDDVVGVELCGALKNVVAVGAGMVDGLKMGDNTKAAIIRIGLLEMKKFIQTFYSGIRDETFFQSCGIADVITSCYGGRNRKVAEAFVLSKKSFEELESELLNGQKLQGTLTAKEIYQVIKRENLENEFPLFTTIYRIAYDGLAPERLVKDIV
ncbi:6254_t:CDS:2 [Paraglomus occultum]|uniref:Glycerol-3-phosphate dehydrogenase [NAD(+)] n=1 Tax=Paraglomus occultum TaxID=144539 RepID=A0A9N8WDY4_9GLOM|nr:6254_t:CDS:2 [Paraglomus occultum]